MAKGTRGRPKGSANKNKLTAVVQPDTPDVSQPETVHVDRLREFFSPLSARIHSAQECYLVTKTWDEEGKRDKQIHDAMALKELV